MFSRILVPLDGSPLAEAILPEVMELAALHGAEVMLLRVALAHAFPGVNQTDVQVRAVEEAEGYLAGVQQHLEARGLLVNCAVRYGHAAGEILEHAQARGATLIAMSTHGRSGIRRWVLGSVAEAVLRASPVPVLLLHAREVAPAGTPAEAGVPGAVGAARRRQGEPSAGTTARGDDAPGGPGAAMPGAPQAPLSAARQDCGGSGPPVPADRSLRTGAWCGSDRDGDPGPERAGSPDHGQHRRAGRADGAVPGGQHTRRGLAPPGAGLGRRRTPRPRRMTPGGDGRGGEPCWSRSG